MYVRQVIYIDYWAYNTTVAERAQIYQGLEDDAQALRDIAPHSGVYWVRPTSGLS